MTSEPTLPSRPPTAHRVRIAAAYYATYVLLGLMLTSIGPSLDALQAQTGSTTGGIALVFTANALGYIAGSLLGGRLYGRIAGHRILATALLALSALTLTVPWLASAALLLLVFGLLGLALGLMDVGGNTLIVWLYRADVPPYMNALHLSFGLGAFVGPLVFAAMAEATGNAATTFWLFAALMPPVALWLARVPSPESPGAVRVDADGRSVIRRHAVIVALIAAFFFLHMGGEMAFGGWIYTYADGLTGSATTARIVNSAFWGGLVLGRLVAIPLALRLSPRSMLQLDLVGSVLSLGLLLVLPGSIPALWIGTIGFGFFVASMIPSSFNLAARQMPISGQVSSAFLVGGSLGSMTLPWLVGQLFVPYGPLSVVAVTAAAMLGAWFLFALIVRRERRPDGEPAIERAPAAGV